MRLYNINQHVTESSSANALKVIANQQDLHLCQSMQPMEVSRVRKTKDFTMAAYAVCAVAAFAPAIILAAYWYLSPWFQGMLAITAVTSTVYSLMDKKADLVSSFIVGFAVFMLSGNVFKHYYEHMVSNSYLAQVKKTLNQEYWEVGKTFSIAVDGRISGFTISNIVNCQKQEAESEKHCAYVRGDLTVPDFVLKRDISKRMGFFLAPREGRYEEPEAKRRRFSNNSTFRPIKTFHCATGPHCG